MLGQTVCYSHKVRCYHNDKDSPGELPRQNAYTYMLVLLPAALLVFTR